MVRRSSISVAHRERPGRRGFTLIEAALTTIIIGLGVVGLVQLLAAGTMANADCTELTTGLNLAKSVHEMSLGVAFCDPTTPTHWGRESNESSLAACDDVDDLDGQSFSPPVDARRQALGNLTGWTQNVTVQSVDPNRLTATVPNGSTPALRITVAVTHNGKQVCELSWVRLDATP